MKKNRVDEFIKDPKKALFTLALPTTIAMLVQTLYTIVDTAFIGWLGPDALAALTFSFPIFFILMALSAGIGVGMSSRISRFMGEKNKSQAENTAMHGLGLAAIIAIIIMVIGLFTLKPLFGLFGATPSVIQLAVDYMTIVLFGVIFMFMTFLISNIFSAQGDTKTPMIVQITALGLNIILDPIFIYVLGYGVKGAAIATTISFVVGFLISVYFLKIRSYLKIDLSLFKPKTHIIKDILNVGIPASLTMLLMSFYLIFLNKFMAHFGTEYVASLGMTFRLESLAVMPMVSMAMALMILTGMFFGAKRYDLLRYIIWFGIKTGVLIVMGIGILFFIFPSLFLRIFTSDANLINIGVPFMRIELLTFPFMTACMIMGRSMQGMGFGMPGFIISMMRSLLLPIPLAYLFVFVFGYGYLSIAAAMVAGGVIASIIAAILLEIKLKKYEV